MSQRVVEHVVGRHGSVILDGQVDNGDEVGAVGRIIRPYAVNNRLHVAFAKAAHVLFVMSVHLLLKLS